jgi:hypothetical protein
VGWLARCGAWVGRWENFVDVVMNDDGSSRGVLQATALAAAEVPRVASE